MPPEFAFTLPRGWMAPDGVVYRDGSMRLATARDEIEPLGDPEVRRNDAYLAVLLLSRVVTRVGPVTDITPSFVEDLYATDFDHLQRVYERLNADGDVVGMVACPACHHTFEVDLTEIQDARLEG